MKRAWILGLLLAATTAWAGNPRVEIRTNQGVMVAELYPEKAPVTVKNFLDYAGSGFYNGTIFHRAMKHFVIQGGGLLPDMSARPTQPAIKNEASNGLKNVTGTLAMARAYDPDSATSQFFINLDDNKHLNYYKSEPGLMGYAVFGKLVSGLDVAQKIGAMDTHTVGAFTDVPVEPVVIESIAQLPEPPAATPPAPSKKTSPRKKRAAKPKKT